MKVNIYLIYNIIPVCIRYIYLDGYKISRSKSIYFPKIEKTNFMIVIKIKNVRWWMYIKCNGKH